MRWAWYETANHLLEYPLTFNWFAMHPTEIVTRSHVHVATARLSCEVEISYKAQLRSPYIMLLDKDFF